MRYWKLKFREATRPLGLGILIKILYFSARSLMSKGRYLMGIVISWMRRMFLKFPLLSLGSKASSERIW